MNFYLERDYEFGAVKDVATAKGFEAKLEPGWFVQGWKLIDGEFTKRCDLGFKLKKKDQVDKGSVRIKVDDNGEVRIAVPQLTLKKSISSEESYEIHMTYDPCRKLKQSVRVIQNGSCNLTSSYVKGQVRKLLQELDIETGWMEKASVEVNRIFGP